MKKLTFTIAFLVALVLGLAVTNSIGQTNNALNCMECCPLGQGTINVRGRLVGADAYSQSLLRGNRVVGVFVYEYRQNLTRYISLNTFNYYNTNVDACEIIIVQPYLKGSYSKIYYLYSDPTQIFRDLYFNGEPDGVIEQDFNLQIVSMN